MASGLLAEQSDRFVERVPLDERIGMSMEPFPTRVAVPEELSDTKLPEHRLVTTGEHHFRVFDHDEPRDVAGNATINQFDVA
jgi:hypothetical protein